MSNEKEDNPLPRFCYCLIVAAFYMIAYIHTKVNIYFEILLIFKAFLIKPDLFAAKRSGWWLSFLKSYQRAVLCGTLFSNG